MRLIALPFAVLLAGCVHPPPSLQGQFPLTTVIDAQTAAHEGERVRWGGTIVSTKLDSNRACLEIVSYRLDRRARPRLGDETTGRFIACVAGFLDPEVFVAKREVTVVGAVGASTRGKVGDYDYVYPRVAAESVFLWPERPTENERPVYYGVGVGGGYWGPWLYGDPFRYGYGHGGYHHHDHGPRPRH